MDSWFEDQLSKGRLLVRGWMRENSPLHANITFICLGEGQRGNAIAIASYISDPEYSALTLRTAGAMDPWRETWSAICGQWIKPGSTSSRHRQIVIQSYVGRNAPIMADGDPRLLVHYGMSLRSIQSGGGSVGSNWAQEAILPKLKAIILSQFSAWGKVITL